MSFLYIILNIHQHVLNFLEPLLKYQLPYYRLTEFLLFLYTTQINICYHEIL
jgi:hypothetical protein